MKYDKRLTRTYEQACEDIIHAHAAEDEYGILCAMHDLMTWARQRTASGYSIRETYKKLMPQLVKGATTLCDCSSRLDLFWFGTVIDRVCQSTAIDDKAAIVNITLLFNCVRYILFTDDYPDDYFVMLNACEESGDDGLVNMLPIVYDPETGDK